ncbi:artemin [Astyanax mexicanus]|uniref:Artemin n=1 Tax=Astyanax mexicanus TaxID=7994 RepID=A0A8T2M0K2_ASTMX|nr:artemin [Astyanax mexicanus]
MTGETAGQRDGKGWRNQGLCTAASAYSNLSFWKVMLLMCVFLLGLVDGWMLSENREESRPTTLRTETKMAQNQQHQPQWESKAAWTELYDPSLAEEGEEYKSRWQRSPAGTTSPVKKRKGRKNRKRQRENKDCLLEKKHLRVRDLGLGYDSDEIVMFKYCVGTCEKSRKNYDLALEYIVGKGGIPGRKVSTLPCCRPTLFETVSFMDARTRWQTIRWLSAANCSCVG